MASWQSIWLFSAIVLTSGIFRLFVAGTEFDFFTFAQSWPPATCVEGRSDHKICHIDASIKTWTVHGLWAESKNGKKDSPHDCNSTWKFNFNEVVTLQRDLNLYWPNLYNNTPKESFWEHEWEKHGTCATSLQATKDEYSFFKKGLELNRELDLISILTKGQVIPSDTKTYSYLDFINAVRDVLGVEPEIECAYATSVDGTPYHLIYQIYICVSKTFEPMNCTYARQMFKKNQHGNQKIQDDNLYFEAGFQSNCPQDKNFYYPQIKPQ